MAHVTGIFIALRSRDFANYWTFERVSRCRSRLEPVRVINADTRLTFINAGISNYCRETSLTNTDQRGRCRLASLRFGQAQRHAVTFPIKFSQFAMSCACRHFVRSGLWINREKLFIRER